MSVARRSASLTSASSTSRTGTVASEALATAHCTKSSCAFVGGLATRVAALERALENAFRPRAEPAAP
jgi:hypothetical protein